MDTWEHEAKLDAILRDIAELNAEVGQTVTAVAKAPNDTARASATVRLTALELARTLMNAHAVAARAAVERDARRVCIKVPKECMDNPLAKGCS